MPIPVIAIFDIGKTNKKLLLLNEQYRIVHEQQTCPEEITDEEGDACEDLPLLIRTMQQQLSEVLQLPGFTVKALNVSAYGASLVYTDATGKAIAPLYNYLKPYPPALSAQLYDTYGGKESFTHTTASPALGSLNAGLQLYRIKHTRPELFARIRYAMHLPQYLSFLFSGKPFSDMTSIGCHTGLWDFKHNSYHAWVADEGLLDKLPPVMPANEANEITVQDNFLKVGIGLHDSSAALVPYLLSFREPFVLLSTGTWCVSMNPFNHQPLTTAELEQDCLCYISYKGSPVKASRLFAGHAHECAIKKMAAHFREDASIYKNMPYDPAIVQTVASWPEFSTLDLARYESSVVAYHHLVMQLVAQQQVATRLVLGGPAVKRLFVDGGFARNSIYMHLLALAFPDMEIYAATVSQASAVGAALAIHDSWNTQPLPTDLVELKHYA